MTAWSLLFVPASLALIVMLLIAMSWIEQRVLSPRALIVHSARSRAGDPDHTEAFVAGQAQGLLEGLVKAKAKAKASAAGATAEGTLLDIAPKTL